MYIIQYNVNPLWYSNTMTEELEFAKQLASQAGEIMKKYFFDGVNIQLKGNTTPVTIADEKINNLVISAVNNKYPNHGVLGEENSHNQGAKYLWVTDPIDGTIPFSLGIPTNVFSLALVIDGEPIIGVVYDPYMDRLYYARKGEGAYMNSKKLKTSDKSSLGQSLIDLSSRKGLFKSDAHYLKLCEVNARLPKYYSLVYGLMQVASGKFEGSIFGHRTAWDVAAAKIIIEEAGGYTSDVYGNNQKYNSDVNGFIAAGNKQLHDKLLDIIKNSL